MLDTTTHENNCRELAVTKVLFSVTIEITTLFQMSNYKQDFLLIPSSLYCKPKDVYQKWRHWKLVATKLSILFVAPYFSEVSSLISRHDLLVSHICVITTWHISSLLMAGEVKRKKRLG